MTEILGAHSPEHCHILLVEDHAQVRQFIELVLVESGFRVTSAENGDRAREVMLAHTDTNLLVSDIRMPGSTDGLQLARWVKENRPSMGIVLQTGYSDIDTGPFTVLRKPFKQEELLTVIYQELQWVR